MRRQLNLIEFALLGLLQRWRKNLALLVVYALVVGFFASVAFLSRTLQREAALMLKDAPEVWIQKLSGGRLEPIPLTIADRLKNIRGIKNIQPRLWGYYYDAPTDAVFTIIGSDAPLPQISGLKLEPGQAVCGSGYVELRSLKKGERLLLFDSKSELHGFTLAGVFDSKTDLITRDLIVLNPQDARTILNLSANQATDLAIRVTNNDESPNIALKISRKIPGVRVVTRDQLQRTYQYLFSWKGGFFFFGALMSLLAFLILAWDRAAGLSAEEKLELGILKGIGWQVQDVLWLKFWEGFSISVTATLLGILAAIIHISILDAWLLKPFFAGWSTLYPNFHLSPEITGNELLILFIISALPYLAATIVPAWRGAVTDPAEIMQNN